MKKLILLMLFFSGCAAWRPLPFRTPSAPAPLPPGYENYYDYPTPSLETALIAEKDSGSYTIKTYEFPLSLPSELALKDPEKFKRDNEELYKTDQKTSKDQKLRYANRVDLYVPKNIKEGERRPAILISPILGGNMVVDHFANYYAGRGFVAALVYRKRLFWDDEKGIEQVEEYLRASVIRLRQAVDWLETRPEADPNRIGAFGISYGAVLHSVLAAVEPRIRYHVLSLPAGSIPEVIVNCPDRAITKLMNRAREKYGWPDERIQEELQKTIKTDPLLLAKSIPKNKVEVYLAAFDRVVGARRSWRLWRAMGRPRLKVLPFGHYGGILVFPYLQTKSYEALRDHLKQS